MNVKAKIAIAIGATVAMFGAIAGLFGFAVTATVLEWDSLPCGGFQTANAPFTAEEVCAEIELGTKQHGADKPPAIAIRWSEGRDGKRAFHTVFGEKAGTTNGSANVEVAFLSTDKPCNTALRHEVKHVLLIREGKDPDAKHTGPGWKLVDGCRP